MIVTEQAKNRVMMILEHNPDKFFRVEIQGGGCAGFQYSFGLSEMEEDDITIDRGIVIDPLSATYLDGSILDFKDDIFTQSFVIDNPNIKSTCGCAMSFSM